MKREKLLHGVDVCTTCRDGTGLGRAATDVLFYSAFQPVQIATTDIVRRLLRLKA